jgi:hypothetical protein
MTARSVAAARRLPRIISLRAQTEASRPNDYMAIAKD